MPKITLPDITLPNIPIPVIVTVAVVLIVFFLLASSLTISFEYDEKLKFKIKYLFFTIMMNPDSPRRIKKKARKEAKKKKKEEKKRQKQENKELRQEKKDSKKARYQKPDPTVSEKKTAARKNQSEEPVKIHYKNGKGRKKPKEKKKKISLELIMAIIRRASPHVKRIFKKIRLYNLYVDITVGGEDAAQTAMSYGVHCSVVNGIAAFLANTVTFNPKKIDIKADFDLEKTDYYAKGTVKLRLFTLLHSGIWGFFAVLSEILKANKEGTESKQKSGSAKNPKKAA